MRALSQFGGNGNGKARASDNDGEEIDLSRELAGEGDEEDMLGKGWT